MSKRGHPEAGRFPDLIMKSTMNEADPPTTGTEKVKPQAAMRWNDPPARSARESFGAVPVTPGMGWLNPQWVPSARRSHGDHFGQDFSFDAGRFEIDDGYAPAFG